MNIGMRAYWGFFGVCVVQVHILDERVALGHKKPIQQCESSAYASTHISIDPSAYPK